MSQAPSFSRSRQPKSSRGPYKSSAQVNDLTTENTKCCDANCGAAVLIVVLIVIAVLIVVLIAVLIAVLIVIVVLTMIAVLIWNLLHPNEVLKVKFLPKPKIQLAMCLHQRKSTDWDDTLWQEFCWSIFPPFIMFPKKIMKQEVFSGASQSSLHMLSGSGFINSKLHIVWIELFKNYVKPSEDDSLPTILNSHTSHYAIEAILS
ncbi:hypothetical protein PR048_004499 [Dryococelus australis]|uniref:Uncharacterized protein n=1 Tax=Dryococelus australis TaxID=614101 RepID=A0ABQ9I6M0_9NEOP|nr:hypothetical protein PR048_004499 [Dryococelus australis]